MNISPKLRDGLIVGGIAIVLLFFLVPRSKGIKKVASNGASKADKTQDARIVLDAFMNAMEAGENAQALNELNKEFVKEYGLKVFQTKQGKFVARTLDGRDVLMVK
jgi:hypothetical protein